MFETIIVLLCAVGGVFFFWDIRRQAVRHQHTVTTIKSKIATETSMTTHFAVFQQGQQESVLLGASGPHDTFWYYKISKEKITDFYKIPLHTILSVQMLVNNQPFKVTVVSNQSSPTLRAAEISRHEVQRMGEGAKRVKSITMLLEYRTAQGPERQQVPLFKALDSTAKAMAVKTLLNSLWWQQYLREFIGKKQYYRTDTAPEDEA